MVSGGRDRRAPRSSERAASVVVPLPRGRTAGRLELARLLPSTRSLLTGFAVVALGVTSFFVARDTGVFAVRTLDVSGAPPAVARQVRDVLRDEVGTSLLRLDRDAVRTRVEAVPTVASVTLDRAFPHTLRLVVVPERPVAVARQGADAWLLSARGRVMARLERGGRPRLPRLWIAKGAVFATGGMAPAALAGPLRALAPLGALHFPARIASVRSGAGELTLLLRSGLELRLGDDGDVELKLAVAARVLPLVASGTRYLDVSVPERPVAGSAPPPTATDATAGTSAAAATGTPSATGSTGPATPQTATTQTGTDVVTSLNSQVEVHGSASSGP